MTVRVFIDREELQGWQTLSLTRSKDDATGSLTLGVFFNYLPTEQVMPTATRGREVLVYIQGHLAFTGSIDTRQDGAARNSDGGTASATIGPDRYEVQLSARGKTKAVVDSAQQSGGTNYTETTNLEVFRDLVAPWDITVDWRASTTRLERWRLRDGARVIDELHRLAEFSGLYINESRDGRMVVTDQAGTQTGEAIVLGRNILSLSTTLSEAPERSTYRVKGHRVGRGQWGADAILVPDQEVNDTTAVAVARQDVQVYGDADDDAIQRRATYEINKRSQAAKRVSVEMFHVQQTDGSPWDIGDLHAVSIPPAGISNVMEVTGLRYNVSADRRLFTTVTLSPTNASAQTQALDSDPLGSLRQFGTVDAVSSLSSEWDSPSVSVAGRVLQSVTDAATDFLQDVVDAADTPQLTIRGDLLNG